MRVHTERWKQERELGIFRLVGRPEEVAWMTLEGLTPQEIADDLGLALSSTLNYLERAVGKGMLRRSDVYFTLTPEVRASPATRGDAEVVALFGGNARVLGDLYEDLRTLETELHERIRRSLEREYGAGELGWWSRGVPENVRKKCQERREEDPNRLEAYCYTDLIDIQRMFVSQWRVLQEVAGPLASDRPEFLERLKKLNGIRNMVMHPARSQEPTIEQVQFVRDLKSVLCR